MAVAEASAGPPRRQCSMIRVGAIVNVTRSVLLARFGSYANPGVPYMFHCHVLDHEDLGMMGQFQVLED